MTAPAAPPGRLPLFTARDLDGFFGLALDNLVQLLLIITLCSGVLRLPDRLVFDVILPASAVSVLLGNLFYAWQAHRLAKAEGRSDVTALPFGINTVSLLVFVFFVMMPEYAVATQAALKVGLSAEEASAAAATAAWRVGCIACLGSGLIEFFGAFVAERLRTGTPRAALLSTLAGIAIGFIAMTFALDIWAAPLVAMLPMGIILVTYFAKVRFPAGLPGGLVAVLAGTALAWGTTAADRAFGWGPGFMSPEALSSAADGLEAAFRAGHGFKPPVWSAADIFAGVGFGAAELLKYASVIVPMGLFNVLGSLQNIESAEAAGDRFATRPSLAVNGIGTLAAALFGSPFPTTIYIGHPGWKGMGARAGYSTLNGLFVTAVCLTGSVGLIKAALPVQAGYPIVFWIGIVITAQAFSATPAKHAPAVAIGLFPSLAAMMAVLMYGLATGPSGQPPLDLQALIESGRPVSGFAVHGLIVLERGSIFAAMILAAAAACLIDRSFLRAAAWMAAAAALTGAGLMHAYKLVGAGRNIVDYHFPFAGHSGYGYRAVGIAAGYALCAALFAGLHLLQRRGWLQRSEEESEDCGAEKRG